MQEVNKIIGAGVLAAIALFMLLGFFESDAARGAGTTMVALLLTVVLPAVGAGLLLRSHFAERSRLSGRKAELRQQTIEAEVLDLARSEAGKLTAVEVAARLAITTEEAKERLDAMTTRGHAEIEITDAGVVVYNFYDVRNLGGKSSARGVLDE